MEKQHTEFDALCIGLVISREYPFIAATPDGFRRCACCGDSVVDIMCPYCMKDLGTELATLTEEGELPATLQC